MHAHAVPAQGALLVRATTVATPRASFSRKSVAVPKAKVRQTAVATASCTDTPSSRASAVTAAVSACWASLATALVTAMPAMAEEAVSRRGPHNFSTQTPFRGEFIGFADISRLPSL